MSRENAKTTVRWVALGICGIVVAGCAASKPSPAISTLEPQKYTPAPAAALAFDPPGADYTPYLSRDDRGITAYGGFQSLSSEFYDVQTSDDQLFFIKDSTYERRVVSDKTGVIFR